MQGHRSRREPIAALRTLWRRNRPLQNADGDAAFLSFAFMYYSAATTLLEGFSRLSAVPAALGSFAFSCAFALPLFFVVAALERLAGSEGLRRVGLGLAWTLVLLQALVSSVDFLSFLYLGERLTVGAVFVLAETNVQESREFVGSYARHQALVLVPLACFLAFPFVVRRVLRRTPLAAPLRRAYPLALLALGATGFVVHDAFDQLHFHPGQTFLAGALRYGHEVAAYRQIQQQLPGVAAATEIVSTSRSEDRLDVLVLGESTSRNHMSLYGYERPTTPLLEGMANELFVFRDVISPHSHTEPTLKKMFTFKNHEAPGEWHEYPILIDLYRAAGYKTFWISNQEPYGVFGNIAAVVASRADVQIFNHTKSSQETSLAKDEELLPYLDRVLSRDPARKKFIVLHLKGTHYRYENRYPESFQLLRPDGVAANDRDFLDDYRRKRITHYDNAVLYNDYVVSRIIERAGEAKTESFVLYLSDHADEVYDLRDYFGHVEKVGSRFMVEIPFLLWLSETYQARHPATVAAVEKNLGSPYMTDDLIHTLLDLSSLSTKEWEAQRSVAQLHFDASRRRFYADKDYDAFLKHDRWKHLVRDNFEKIWAHRVNSVGKLESAAGIFSGVELDLVFQANPAGSWFDVNHPPRESIGLSLDSYLASIDEPARLRYWLDIKNLTLENREAVLERLLWLMEKHGLGSDRVIAESRNFEALQPLTEAGLETSYYLPYLELDEMTAEERERTAAELADNANSVRIGAISFPGYMLDYVQEEVRPHLQDPELALLTWFPDRRIESGKDAVFLQEVANDEAIEVVLVGHRTRHDR